MVTTTNHLLQTDDEYCAVCRSYHDPTASVEEGLAVLKRCIDEVSKRFVVSPGRYKVKIVDQDGTREVEL